MNLLPSQTVSAVYAFNRKSELKRPLFACSVSAGFPSPAEDYIEGRLDLNELMVANPSATFFVRVAGDSMIGAGIHHNDILVVDRSLEPISGKVVIAVVNGELTVKRMLKDGETFYLKAENSDYPDIHMTEGSTCEIWGVVSFVVHSL
ncbi:MAG: translesion error-prone DNA polymerase V autoproteolytic subunit [Desulfobulbaceae bacterium]|nr:translesion error-prone DNA polymerase V autoproteolytic subunit [Desulfobulbaceae bacterium]